MKIRILASTLLVFILVSCSGIVEYSQRFQPTPSPTAVTPRVTINTGNVRLKVGDTTMITGFPQGIGLPYYTLNVQESGALNATVIVRVTYDNKVSIIENRSPLIEFVSASGSITEATFLLKGKKPGALVGWINATGEILGGAGSIWAGGGSEKVQITINP